MFQPSDVSPVMIEEVVQDGRWHHVMVAVGNDSVQFYLDGAPIASRLVLFVSSSVFLPFAGLPDQISLALLTHCC